ncbi:MAG: DUF1549 domain-containing protein, partial [Planctomycetota bacterium]
MICRFLIVALLCAISTSLAHAKSPSIVAKRAPVSLSDATEWSVSPAHTRLAGRRSRQQILITATIAGERVDATSALGAGLFGHRLEVETTPAGIVHVDRRGVIRATRSGTVDIVFRVRREDGGTRVSPPVARCTVDVVDAEKELPVDFRHDVQAVLTKAGCNAGACHGKQRGQNGFQLSLLGFDPQFDFHALVSEGRGRRIFPASPRRSLLLEKATATIPHGGGRRVAVDDRHYSVLLRWISAGMPYEAQNVPQLANVVLEPAERTLAPLATQQLRATAVYEDGKRVDVTHLATFSSSESPIAKVDQEGFVTAGPLPGEAAIMARFMGQIAVSRILIPLPGSVEPSLYASLPVKNEIDRLVWKKLERLRVVPSGRCDDASFLRRAYVDLIGRLPTADEARDFLVDIVKGKRERLIDHLLEQPEYADFMANKWADLLRPNPYRVDMKAVHTLDGWLRDAFRKNLRYDQFVRELVAARGSTFRHGPATLYRDRRSPDEIATMVSQIFLGIRLECAKCHQHPFERWSQHDFYSFSAYFSRVGRKGTGLSPPISGSEEFIFASSSARAVKHPISGKTLAPRPLFGRTPKEDPDADLRDALVEWMVSDENPYFPRVIANRVWMDL